MERIAHPLKIAKYQSKALNIVMKSAFNTDVKFGSVHSNLNLCT